MQAFVVTGFLVFVLATFTYLPDDVVCQLDSSCNIDTTFTKMHNDIQVDNNKQALDLIANMFQKISTVINP